LSKLPAMVFAYPWLDTRLWLPILPLLMGYVSDRGETLAAVLCAAACDFHHRSLFCLLEIVALGYWSRLTFAGSQFRDL
jgi:hypothetical protein